MQVQATAALDFNRNSVVKVQKWHNEHHSISVEYTYDEAVSLRDQLNKILSEDSWSKL